MSGRPPGDPWDSLDSGLPLAAPTFEQLAGDAAKDPPPDPPLPEPEGPRYLPVDPETGALLPEGSDFVLLGQGGLGQVYAAWDPRLERVVAVKVLAPGAGGQARAADRFLREARLTARLDHPAIVTVHETGTWRDGRRYYAMRRIRGRTLDSALRGCAGLRERLRLLGHFADLCHAVAAAHRQGVVHRDIKPSNVMIDDLGETQVVDWGIARGLSRSTPGDPGLSGAAGVAGTPAYMSPEQAAGAAGAADARADVWSLGAVLFELLAGERLYPGEDVERVLAKARAGRPRVRARCKAAPEELIAVAERALRRDPAARYPDASALALDIDAFRQGALVGAFEYTAWDHLARFLSRYRAAVRVAAVAAGALAATGLVSLNRVLAERDRAVRAEAVAVSERGAALTRLADSLEAQAETAWLQGNAPMAMAFAAAALEQGHRPDVVGILSGASRLWAPALLGAPDRECRHALVAPGGRGAACLDGDQWTARAAPDAPLALDMPALIEGWSRPSVAALAPDAAALILAMDDGRLLSLDPSSGAVRALEGAGPGLRYLAISEDGRWLYGQSGGIDNGREVLAWSLESGRITARRPLRAARGLAASPDGRWVAIGAESGAELLDAATLERVRVYDLFQGVGWLPGFSPDSGRLAISNQGGGLWFAQTEGEGVVHAPIGGGVGAVRWAAGGRLVLASMEDGGAYVIDPLTGQRLFTFPLPGAGTHGARLLWGDRLVLMQLRGGGAQLWALTGVEQALGLYGRPSRGAAVLQTGDLLIAGGPDGTLVGERSTGAILRRLEGGRRVSLTEDGRDLLISTGQALVLEGLDGGGRREIPLETGRRIWSMGEVLVDSTEAGIAVFDPADGHTLRECALPAGGIVSWRIAGERVLAVAPDQAIVALDPSDCALTTLATLADTPFYLSFTEGPWMAVGTNSGQVVVLDHRSGEALATLQVHEGRARRAAVSPDARRVASADHDHLIHVTDVESGRLLARLNGDHQRLQEVAFSPDGQLLISADLEGRLLSWDLSFLERDPAGLADEIAGRFGVRYDGAFRPAELPAVGFAEAAARANQRR
jgi:hypothetical protein